MNVVADIFIFPEHDRRLRVYDGKYASHRVFEHLDQIEIIIDKSVDLGVVSDHALLFVERLLALDYFFELEGLDLFIGLVLQQLFECALVGEFASVNVD